MFITALIIAILIISIYISVIMIKFSTYVLRRPDYMNRALEVKAQFKQLHPDGSLPFKKRDTDAAYDIYSIEDAVVPAHGIKNVDSGIAVAVPPGYYFTVEARSSLGKIGIIPMRGIIDAGYCDVLKVILTNQTNEDYYVKKGDRIAQIIPHLHISMFFERIEKFGPEYSSRGSNGMDGWGSSGR